MLIGEKIKKARINANLTQIELADMVGVTRNTISKIENSTCEHSGIIKSIINILIR